MIGKIYYDPDDESQDGRGWNVVGADNTALRYETLTEALARAFDVHPGHEKFLVDVYGLQAGILTKLDENDCVLMLMDIPDGVPPLRDVPVEMFQ